MAIVNFEGFAREILSAWPEGGIDGFDMQDLAVKYGLLRETTYDPEKHGDDLYGCSEKGDPWFVKTYT